jgi:hypothetical protein
VIRRNIPPSIALGIVALVGGTTFVFASTIQGNQQVFQAMFGTYANVTNSLSAVDEGINMATQPLSPAGISRAFQVNFSSVVSVATNGVTPGDWVITVKVNMTASTPSNTSFIVNLGFDEAGESLQQFRLYIGTGLSVSPNYEILCIFDVGSSLSSPYSYTFSIQ